MNCLVSKLPNEYMSDLRFYLNYQFSECDFEKKCTKILLPHNEKTSIDYLGEYLNYMTIMGNTEKVESTINYNLLLIRCACKTEGELAVVDLLYSTGMRVGETCKIRSYRYTI